jgi:hypothetical protein
LLGGKPIETLDVSTARAQSTPTDAVMSLLRKVILGSRISELEHDALRQLKKAKPRLLAIDEIHHLLACILREQRAALNVVKFLSTNYAFR